MAVCETPLLGGKRNRNAFHMPENASMSALPGAREAYIGPDARSQRIALKHLEGVAAEQARPRSPSVSPDTDRSGFVASSGRHEAPPAPAARAMLARHGSQFMSFSIIGIVVFVLGVAVQGLLVRFGAGAYGSYAGQAIFSIELSFMLNRRFTWQGRNTGLWRSFWRFNAQKLLLTIPNLALYALMIELGSGWLIANLGTTVVLQTAVNYATGDLWSFARRGSRRLQMTPGSSPESCCLHIIRRVLPHVMALNGARYADPRAIHEGLQPRGALSMRSAPPMRQRHPLVSVVIPCKGNESTIRATVAALLAQDYPALIEVILVGDVGDSTWSALADIRDPRLILLEQEKTPGKCDPNVKRDKGLRKASGDILALADSDIVMDPGLAFQGCRAAAQPGEEGWSPVACGPSTTPTGDGSSTVTSWPRKPPASADRTR